jgi:hypothetical protein
MNTAALFEKKTSIFFLFTSNEWQCERMKQNALIFLVEADPSKEQKNEMVFGLFSLFLFR